MPRYAGTQLKKQKNGSVVGQVLYARMYDGNVGNESLGATTKYCSEHTGQQQQVMEGEWVCYAISIQNINGFSDPASAMHRHAAVRSLPRREDPTVIT